MVQKIKSYLLIVAAPLLMLTPALVTSGVAYAVNCGNISANISEGANQASGEGGQTGDCSQNNNVDNNSIGKLGNKVVNTFSLVIGIIAIIMIIYGGFRYITSGGASERVGNAKNTLIYAIVGLIIVALAQIIVHFVLNQTNTAVSGP